MRSSTSHHAFPEWPITAIRQEELRASARAAHIRRRVSGFEIRTVSSFADFERLSLPVFLLLGVLMCITPSALAHRIDVSAAVEPDGVYVTVQDSHGTAIADAEIEITDPDGNVLAQGEADADGRFSFTLATIPEHVNIVAKTADGHKASLTLSREQLTSMGIAVVGPADQAEHMHSTPADGIDSDMDEIEELHGILAKQQAELDDLQAQLLRLSQPKQGIPRESVIAGIGFIFGLTGFIAACFALRRVAGKDY